MSTVTQEIQDQVSSLYIAFFGRAPDAKGFGHWAEELAAGASPFKIAADFALSPEWTSNYGGLTPTQQVNRFYQNTFGRQADAAGLEYWVDEIEGGLPFSTVAYQIIWAAYLGGDTVDPADNALVLNKIAVAEYFAIELSSNDTAIAATAFVNVTQNPATVTEAEARLAVAVNPPETFTLTTNIDNFVGKSLDVEFTGVSGSTLNTGDTLTGGPGVSTFNITGNGGSAIVETTGIQTVNVRAVSDTTINQVLMSGVAAASSQNSLKAVTFTNAQLATTYGLFNTNNIVGDTANLSVTYQAASGTADTALLSVNNAGGKVGSNTITQTINTTASTGDIEAISLATAGSNQVTLAGGAKVAAVDVSGNGTNTITLTSAATTMTLDASESSGTNTFIVGDLLSTTDIILGGSGTDTLRGNLSTATQMLPSVTGVETLDLTFTAAGIFNATNVTGTSKLIVTNTAAATFTNVSDDVVDVQVGKTADVTGAGLTVGYATGSVSDVKFTVGATPSTTGATAAVSTGDVTFTGNKAGLRIESVGTAANTVGDLTVDAVTSLSLVGKSQALTAGDISAKAAATLTVDATAKSVTAKDSIVDETLSTLNVTAGAGTVTLDDVTLAASTTTAAINTVFNVTSSGTKNASAGTVAVTGGGAAGSVTNVTMNLSSSAGDATTGTVVVTGLTVDEGATGTSSTALVMAAAAGNVTLTTLTLTDSDSSTITVSAAADQTATITNLAGTSNLNTITASGAGAISLFAGGTTAVVGNTVIDAAGSTGGLTVNLSSAAVTNNISVTLGNAASGEKNVISTGLGADVIIGGTGADSINGGAGADVITGGSGNDTIIGAADDDVITLGAGNDVIRFVQGSATTIAAFDTANGTDTVADFTAGTSTGSDRIDWKAALFAINGTAIIAYQDGELNEEIAAGTTVYEIAGALTDGTAAGLVAALGTAAVNATLAAGDALVFVNYTAGNVAQVWYFVNGSGADVTAAELTLAATLQGVTADSLVAGNFFIS